jgi:hypothetical protein
VVNKPSTGPDPAPHREYEPHLGHTIWELERALKLGQDSEALRRALVEAHADQLRQLEDRAGVPRPQRSYLLLQPRPTEAILLLAGEGAGADETLSIGEHFYARGFTALGSSLAYRDLAEPSRSPHYWQTCADEAENRYDALVHYATRVAVLGVGLGAIMALHVASVRRVTAVLAVLPVLHVGEPWQVRLRATMRRLLRRPEKTPPGWTHQRHLAAASGQSAASRLEVPLFLIAEERHDRSDTARTAQMAHKLVSRHATQVRLVPVGQLASARDLPPALLDELLAFARPR